MFSPSIHKPIGLDKLREVYHYTNPKARTRKVIWTNREAVREIIKSNPLESEALQRQVDFFTLSFNNLIFGYTDSTHFSFVLSIGMAILLRDNITIEQRSFIEKQLSIVEEIALKQGFIKGLLPSQH